MATPSREPMTIKAMAQPGRPLEGAGVGGGVVVTAGVVGLGSVILSI